MMITLEIVLFLLTGALAGGLAGLLGVGGGAIVVPLLVFIFHQFHIVQDANLMQVAAATSLCVMIATSVGSFHARWRLGLIDTALLKSLWPGVMIGVVLGVMLAVHLNSATLQIIFAVFLISLACYMLFGRHPLPGQDRPHPVRHLLVSFLIGLKSGLLGIGGGAIVVPYLIYSRVDIRRATAAASACTLPVSVIGALSYCLLGLRAHVDLPYATGYIYWPAVICVAITSVIFVPLGLKLAQRISTERLKTLFSCLLIAVAIKMLF